MPMADSNDHLPPLVFSIRPEYVARILDGTKRWEFRRKRPTIKFGERALVYESRGRGRIVAEFTRGVIVVGRPAEVWNEVIIGGGGHGIGPDDFFRYFNGTLMAYAIQLLDVKPLDMELPAGMRAPQSWARLRAPAGNETPRR